MKLGSFGFKSVVVITLVVLQACAVDEGPFYIPSGEPDNSILSYGTDIQPIFNSNCIACHSESHPKLSLLSEVSYLELTVTGFSAPYIDTVTPTNSKLYKHLTGELLLMPTSGKLPDHQINKIVKWIQQGANDN